MSSFCKIFLLGVIDNYEGYCAIIIGDHMGQIIGSYQLGENVKYALDDYRDNFPILLTHWQA